MEHIFKLTPPLKEYIWAGNKLSKYKDHKLNKISESFELSFLINDESKIVYQNKEISILDFINIDEIKPFINLDIKKLLIKLIDSNDSLSIQVHPSDEYAKKYENSLGKTELWIILESEPSSFIYLGFNKDITSLEFNNLIKNNKITNVLNKVYVNKGDIFLINPGTIHAIGEGLTLLEIQESSKLTYRVYDFDRIDKNGCKRELHLDKAKKVLNFNKLNINNLKEEKVINTNYFNIRKDTNNGNNKVNIERTSVITIIEGEGYINNLKVTKYQSYFLLPYNNFIFNGNFTYVLSSI